MCNFCGLKGHKEIGCFKKFPEKAPAWYKEKIAKVESAASSMEVTLASLNPDQLGVTKIMTHWRYSVRKMYGFATQVRVRM